MLVRGVKAKAGGAKGAKGKSAGKPVLEVEEDAKKVRFKSYYKKNIMTNHL